MSELKTQILSAQPGGMNASMHPTSIPDGQYARGVNISVRNGYPKTRPGFHMFSDVVSNVLPPGADRFQGAGIWRTDDGVEVVVVFSGVVYLVNRTTGAFTYNSGPLLNATNQVYIDQSGPYLLIHERASFLALEWGSEGPSVKITTTVPTSLLSDPWAESMQSVSLHTDILNYIEDAGDPAPTYAEARTEVLASLDSPTYPMGTISCYAYGRTHLVCPDPGPQYFRSSDLLIPSDPSSVLRWWEDSYLNEGGALGLPDELGAIRGMAVIKNSDDTASGLGPLIAMAQDGAVAFGVHHPRAGTFDLSISTASGTLTTGAKMLTPGWKDRQIGQVLYYGNGTESPWSLCRVNGDLMYRAADGVRSVKSTAAAAAGAVVANPNMSAEVAPFIAFDSGVGQLGRVSAACAGNRVLMTAKQSGVGYLGIISLDLAVLSLLDRTATVGSDTKYIAYDGLWTGVTVGKLLQVGDEALIVATDGRLYAVSDSQWDLVDGARRDIECQYITKSVDFGIPGYKKTLSHVDVWLRDMLGDVSLTVYYRPDGYPWWTYMDTKDIECPMDMPSQERRRLRFKPSHTSKTAYDGTVLTQGETFQFLLVWTGQTTVHRITVGGYPQTESPPVSTDACDFANIERDGTQLEQNDFSYPGG